MAIFIYQGTGPQGERAKGEIEAGSRQEALRKLRGDRILPLSLLLQADVVAGRVAPKRTGESEKLSGPAKGSIRLSAAQIILFTDELSDFLHSGLQLEPALQLIENREERSPVKQVAAALRVKVRDGISFSDALTTASDSFGELYCNLVGAGEISGALAPILRRQSIHLSEMAELRGRIKLALIYPAALVIAGTLAVAIFMTVLVPQMTNLLTTTGGTMPLPTKILVTLGDVSRHYGLEVIVVVAAMAACFVGYIRQPAGRRWWDEQKIKIPLIGSLLSAGFFAQFCQTLANLLENGLPLLSALKLVTRATGNLFYRSLLIRIAELVGEGASLTRAMKGVGHFPPTLRDLVKVGEQTGELGGTMAKVGVRYEKIIQQRIDRIMSIVPLLITTAIGAMVLLIAWSMMSGIFEAIHGLQAHH
jgi:general secretion pathway protein F